MPSDDFEELFASSLLEEEKPTITNSYVYDEFSTWDSHVWKTIDDSQIVAITQVDYRPLDEEVHQRQRNVPRGRLPAWMQIGGRRT